MKVYVYMYNGFLCEDFEITNYENCAKVFKTKKEINYYLKVMKLSKYDIEIRG